jgi:hypothetical protein
VNGVRCDSSEQTVCHSHAHLAVFVSGQRQTIPYGIGIPGGTASQGSASSGSCFYWLHTHDQVGVLHIESPVRKLYTLGDCFAIWGQPVTAGQVGPVKGTVYRRRQALRRRSCSDHADAHKLIQIDVGKDVPPQSFTFPAGE